MTTHPAKRFLLTLAGMAMLGSNLSLAQDAYPAKPIRLVVGFAAGGSTDIPARYIADKLGSLLGQRVIVENKPAAAGMLATRDVLGQPKDGYNLLLCTHFESINAAVYRNAGYELGDLAPISLISKYYYGLALANSVPALDLAAFAQYAKAHPGAISYGTIGAGSAQEIFARQLERLTGITMNRVPYRGGAQALQDLLPGRVQFFVSPMFSIIPLANEGALRDSRSLQPGPPRRRAAGAHAARAGRRFRPVRLARHLRRGRHGAANHRPSQSPHRGHRRVGGLSGGHRTRRLHPRIVDPGGAARGHRADPRRRRGDDQGVRAAAGSVRVQ